VSRPKIRNFKMALAIATNNAALNAAASASSVNRDMETSMARLSSGKRINSASDDAAGVAISSRLSAEIRGTDQAIRNALDGQALIDTAEGAHSEIENILQRMREVSVQAANDTNNDQDRANLQAEMNALVTEIDRIAGTTTWAGEKLMEEESGTNFSFQVGAKTGEKNQINITINGMGAKALNLQADPTDVQKTLNNVTVGSSTNTQDYDPATEIRQGSISSGGVVSANNGNTSITLPNLMPVTIVNTPAVSTTSTANDTSL
jgi:flagellin